MIDENEQSIVLTRAQMKELTDMGIDTSDASMLWISHPNPNPNFAPYNPIVTYLDIVGQYGGSIEEEEVIPTYTADDIMRKLPRFIQPFLHYDVCIANGNAEDKWMLDVKPFVGEYWSVKYVRKDFVPSGNGYCDDDYHRDDVFFSEIDKSLVQCLFKVLKKCKEKNYI